MEDTGFTPQTLAKIINEEFKPPFVKEGLVKSRVNQQGDFILKIGRRDVQIKADGCWVGAGTELKTSVEDC